VLPSCALLGGFAIGAHDNIAANAKCQRVLVLALCLVEAVEIDGEDKHIPTWAGFGSVRSAWPNRTPQN